MYLWYSWNLEGRWLSVGSDLKFDARRDLDDVKAEDVEGKNQVSCCENLPA